MTSSVEYYLPRLSDRELSRLAHIVIGCLDFGNQYGDCPLYEWLANVMIREQQRRFDVEDGEVPPEVEFLRLPRWNGAELGSAVVHVGVLASLPLTPEQGRFVDQICGTVNVAAKQRLTAAGS